MPSVLKRFLPQSFSLLHVGADALLLSLSLYVSLWMRTGGLRLEEHLGALNRFVAVFIVIRLVCFLGFGVYQCLWRYFSTHDAVRLASATIFSMPLFVSVTYLAPSLGYLPRSFFFIDLFVAVALLTSARLARRYLYERQMQPAKSQVSLGKMIIYGAGQNGRLLAQRLLSDPKREHDLLGFIDDDLEKRGKRIAGLNVLGEHRDLESILTRSGCTDLVIAITSPPPELMRELIVVCRKHRIRMSRIAQLSEEQSAIRNEVLYRQVELKDLLNRPSADIDLPKIKELIDNKVVLVTGAGGSIGSEIARQIARLNPKKLLLLDHSEFALYEIDRELRPTSQSLSTVIPLLIDVKEKLSLDHVFSQFRPEVVFHAAAYKHVHLVEVNVSPAILNNVLGTKNLIETCERHMTERFVMISSDKAVNPVGAMGATKRVGELLTNDAGRRTGRPFTSVRFGNVLGSSGSLVPALRKQIEDGGPITLTHPDMTRYFMLIPEAVSLVLMSATLSHPGDINVLKMGEPIRILDLAKSFLALMGKTENEIAVAFTGVRPGEKMFEELYLTGAELATRHPDILTVPRENTINGETLEKKVDQLVHLAQSASEEALPQLLALANHREMNYEVDNSI